MKKFQFSYAILVENTPDKYLHQESTFLDSLFESTKYALIEKQCFGDGSEGINRIIYSDDKDLLTKQMYGYVSWYDYVIGQSKSLQGYISELP